MELISSCNFLQGTGGVYKVTKGEITLWHQGETLPMLTAM